MHVEGDCETTYLTHSLALTGKLGCECSRYVCTDRKWDRQKMGQTEKFNGIRRKRQTLFTIIA